MGTVRCGSRPFTAVASSLLTACIRRLSVLCRIRQHNMVTRKLWRSRYVSPMKSYLLLFSPLDWWLVGLVTLLRSRLAALRSWPIRVASVDAGPVPRAPDHWQRNNCPASCHSKYLLAFQGLAPSRKGKKRFFGHGLPSPHYQLPRREANSTKSISTSMLPSH